MVGIGEPAPPQHWEDRGDAEAIRGQGTGEEGSSQHSGKVASAHKGGRRPRDQAERLRWAQGSQAFSVGTGAFSITLPSWSMCMPGGHPQTQTHRSEACGVLWGFSLPCPSQGAPGRSSWGLWQCPPPVGAASQAEDQRWGDQCRQRARTHPHGGICAPCVWALVTLPHSGPGLRTLRGWPFHRPHQHDRSGTLAKLSLTCYPCRTREAPSGFQSLSDIHQPTS